jgi:hypothetical protein
MADPGILQFSKRQIPDDFISKDDVIDATAWRFNQVFVEAVDGARRFFTLAESFKAEKILVFKNGIKQIPTEEIILHSPNVVEFVVAPVLTPTVDYIDCHYLLESSEESSNWIVDETMGGTKDSVNKDFTTFYPYVPGKIMPFKNGKKLIPGASYDYVEIDPKTIRLTIAPGTGDFLEVTYFKQT